MAATTYASTENPLADTIVEKAAIEDGSKCTELPGTYTCGDSSTLLVCIFNVWKFQSKCPEGTTCSNGLCGTPSDSNSQSAGLDNSSDSDANTSTNTSTEHVTDTDAVTNTDSATDTDASTESGDSSDGNTELGTLSDTDDNNSTDTDDDDDTEDSDDNNSASKDSHHSEETIDFGDMVNIVTLNKYNSNDHDTDTSAATGFLALRLRNICMAILLSAATTALVVLA
ncbi:hypothetical protein LPJ72_006100 [Coemansia sp. Benny D160-2]|nr:hypothetical protein LPJ72_006100 [Coemansia sp. Benny D160-2]